MKINRIFAIVIFIAGFMCGALLFIITTPKVNLPEEYQFITHDTNIKGEFVKQRGSLNIEFDHDIRFIWNDVEESIPPDGSLIMLEYTDENNVYIGPYYPELH